MIKRWLSQEYCKNKYMVIAPGTFNKGAMCSKFFFRLIVTAVHQK